MELVKKILLLGDPQALGYQGVFELMIQFHVSFGLMSLIAGTVILALSKGTQTHRTIGRIFVVLMLCNFLLGVPLGTIGQLMAGRPANLMTAIGAMFVGTVVFSGYRLASAGVAARAWYDKAMLAFQVFVASLYLYLVVLMILGDSLFGFSVYADFEGKPFLFGDNRYPLFAMHPVAFGTAGGTMFAYVASESFIAPLFYVGLTAWLSRQDWSRVRGTANLTQGQVVGQHFTRMLLAFAGSVTAVLLNTGWLSFAMCWLLPLVSALALSAWFRRAGTRTTSPAHSPV
jgi:uncharacterized membrane protein